MPSASAFEADAEATDPPTAESSSFVDSLPREKKAELQSIDADYRELTAQILSRSSGLIAPEDREKLTLLERAKTDDLGNVLTPPELEEYQRRTADTDRLRRR